MDKEKTVVIDDHTPITRTFTAADYAPAWGSNQLDRDWEDFSPKEEAAANKIGMPTDEQ